MLCSCLNRRYGPEDGKSFVIEKELTTRSRSGPRTACESKRLLPHQHQIGEAISAPCNAPDPAPEQLPVLSGIAKGFGVFDHWFCEVPHAHCRWRFGTTRGRSRTSCGGGSMAVADTQPRLRAAMTPAIRDR